MLGRVTVLAAELLAQVPAVPEVLDGHPVNWKRVMSIVGSVDMFTTSVTEYYNNYGALDVVL